MIICKHWGVRVTNTLSHYGFVPLKSIPGYGLFFSTITSAGSELAPLWASLAAGCLITPFLMRVLHKHTRFTSETPVIEIELHQGFIHPFVWCSPGGDFLLGPCAVLPTCTSSNLGKFPAVAVNTSFSSCFTPSGSYFLSTGKYLTDCTESKKTHLTWLCY